MSESREIRRSESVPSGEVSAAATSDALTDSPRLLFNPPIDIYETTEGLVLYADLPGVNAEGLDLQVQDNRLSLFGRVDSKIDPSQVIHQEYQVGDYLRSFILSDEVDHERITARLNNGVLRVELPRAHRPQPRRIEVSTD